ncbi:conjugal transfer protein TraD [Mesorhizobium sp. INR15]|nr:conjugal transfer protein TraD [Mesorhizobium sp. INR15]
METVMRKPRDFDAELKALDKARELKTRKVQQLSELVIATGADQLSTDEPAGALVAMTETKDAAKREAWAARGVMFFESGSRRTAPASQRNFSRRFSAIGQPAIAAKRHGHAMTCGPGRSYAVSAPGI